MILQDYFPRGLTNFEISKKQQLAKNSSLPAKVGGEALT
jgi:hypothetical protein